MPKGFASTLTPSQSHASGPDSGPPRPRQTCARRPSCCGRMAALLASKRLPVAQTQIYANDFLGAVLRYVFLSALA